MDDTVLRYVRPGHRWLLVAAGVVTVVLALTGAVRDLRQARRHRDGGPPAPARPAADRTGARSDHPEPGADHGHDRSRAPWLLLLPVLVIALVAPPALGADAVERTAGGVVRGADLYPPLPGGTLELGLGEVVDRAVWDESRSVAGREVVVTGFLARRRTGRGDRETVLARMRISCCAADARPSAVRLRGLVLDPVPEDGERWLRVRGTVVPGTGNTADRYTPDLAVAEAADVAAPADPYEQ